MSVYAKSELYSLALSEFDTSDFKIFQILARNRPKLTFIHLVFHSAHCHWQIRYRISCSTRALYCCHVLRFSWNPSELQTFWLSLHNTKLCATPNLNLSLPWCGQNCCWHVALVDNRVWTSFISYFSAVSLVDQISNFVLRLSFPQNSKILFSRYVSSCSKNSSELDEPPIKPWWSDMICLAWYASRLMVWSRPPGISGTNMSISVDTEKMKCWREENCNT